MIMRTRALVDKTVFVSRSVGRKNSPLASITEAKCAILIAAAWSLPVGLTLLSITQQAVFVTAIGAAIISGLLMTVRPKATLIALPFFALLSPVAGFLDLLGVHVLLSDLLFVLLAIQALVLTY